QAGARRRAEAGGGDVVGAGLGRCGVGGGARAARERRAWRVGRVRRDRRARRYDRARDAAHPARRRRPDAPGTAHRLATEPVRDAGIAELRDRRIAGLRNWMLRPIAARLRPTSVERTMAI